ncbi:hypothetical protein Tsp_11063 [Trichinella spiralis]|uniref:hypothetical protein n=1 Tax=Trichinella spiralis TaxID=6334 RepID=UPI0001EFB9A6|nr:hypothetical protein Tsp_11063 [Trichinella spiralis]
MKVLSPASPGHMAAPLATVAISISVKPSSSRSLCIFLSGRVFWDVQKSDGKPIPNIGQSISSSQLLLQAVWGGLEISPHKTCSLHPFFTSSCPWQRPDIDLLEIIICRQLRAVLFCFERKSFHHACCCCIGIGTERGGGERERVDLISTHLQPTAIFDGNFMDLNA